MSISHQVHLKGIFTYLLALQDERISGVVEVVHRDLERILTNGDMTSGFRTAAKNLGIQLTSLFQTLHDAAFKDLPDQMRQRIISPMLTATHRCTENFYQQLGATPDFIDAVQAARSGVPPSSGMIQNDQQQTLRQPRRANQTPQQRRRANQTPQQRRRANQTPQQRRRANQTPQQCRRANQKPQQRRRANQIPQQHRRANQINALPQLDPRQVNENPPPPSPPAGNTTWLDHLQHVVQFCVRNWELIALGVITGIAVGGKS